MIHLSYDLFSLGLLIFDTINVRDGALADLDGKRDDADSGTSDFRHGERSDNDVRKL